MGQQGEPQSGNETTCLAFEVYCSEEHKCQCLHCLFCCVPLQDQRADMRGQTSRSLKGPGTAE